MLVKQYRWCFFNPRAAFVDVFVSILRPSAVDISQPWCGPFRRNLDAFPRGWWLPHGQCCFHRLAADGVAEGGGVGGLNLLKLEEVEHGETSIRNSGTVGLATWGIYEHMERNRHENLTVATTSSDLISCLLSTNPHWAAEVTSFDIHLLFAILSWINTYDFPMSGIEWTPGTITSFDVNTRVTSLRPLPTAFRTTLKC